MQENINIPDSNITTNLTFRNLCFMNMQRLTNFPYIEKDFDAISDYQLLCKVVEYLNKVIKNSNDQNDSITNLYNSFVALQTYVNSTKDSLEDAFNTLDNYVRNYFANLNVQDEIDHKLDEYVADGTLEHIIASYLQTQKIYDTHDEMIADASSLVDGLTVQTLGYHSINDGGGAFYKITNTESSDFYQDDLENGLYASLIETEITPEMFGAYGDGTHDDHDALLKVIKYAFDNTASIVIGTSTDYEARTIKFNNKTYYNGSTIVFNTTTTVANSINIDGNGAYITGYGFKFESTAGWKLNIRNLNFHNITTAFEFDARNLEYGNYIFDSLQFSNIVNPFIMNRRSCIVEIKNCVFRGVESIGEFTNVDRLNFHHNWISSSGNISNIDYKSMLKQTTGDEGAMFVYNNLFVPIGGTNCKELCWIEVNEHARIYNNRFGGENVNFHPLRIGAGFLPKGGLTSKYPYLSFDHNDEVSGQCPIIFESIAGNMIINFNQGYIAGQKMIIWSDKVDATAQASLIAAQNKMLNLVIENNVGRNSLRNGDGSGIPNDYIPTIPTNLFGLINRGLKNVGNNSGENAAYLKYMDITQSNEMTLTIANQPFDNISAISTAGRFTAKNNFAILVWCGYGYNTNYTNNCSYMLINFNLDGTDLIMKTNYLGGTLPITAKFTNDTDTIDITTLNGVSELTIKLVTDGSNKVIKGLKAQIFRPHDELACFI